MRNGLLKLVLFKVSKTGLTHFGLWKIVDQIKSIYTEPCNICICDNGKTVIKQDSFRVCSNNYITHAFNGDFYTGFQLMRFDNKIRELKYDLAKSNSIEPDDLIYNDVHSKNYFVISTKIGMLWERILEILGLKKL